MKSKQILCRVCLQCDNDDVSSIFEENDKSFIYEKLNTIAEVHIKPEDGLPDKICGDCLLELENAINFKQKCETSNSILLAMNTGIGPTQDNEDPLDTVKSEPEECADQEYFEEDVWSPSEVPIKSDPDLQLEDTEPHTPPDKKSRPIDLLLECHDCGGSFKSKCKLKVHWKTVHLKEQLTCPICRTSFRSFKKRYEHDVNKTRKCKTFSQVNVTGEKENRVLHCRECDYTTPKIAYMNAHLVKHTGELKYACKQCPKRYTQLGPLQTHIESKHGTKKQIICKICSELVLGTDKYRYHLSKHREFNPFVTCEICNKSLKKMSLRRHIRIAHSDVRTFACDKCAATYKTLHSLQMHNRNVHLNIKHFKCDKCEYRAKSHTMISKHRRKHTGNDFPCTTCGRFYDNDLQLSLHKQKHTNRDHKCQQCDSTFFARKNLLKHLNNIHKIYLTK